MWIDRLTFIAFAVLNERQLDAAWHLELVAEFDEARATKEDPIALALRLVIDREGTTLEGEITLSQDGADVSFAIKPGSEADELEPLHIELSAEFDERETEIVIDQRDDGDFNVRIEDVDEAPDSRIWDAAVLAGGVGAARFLDGLIRVMRPENVTAIVNVGDDMEWAGLHIAPDLDTVTYTLAGLVNPEMGWGVAGDGRRVLERLRSLGGPAWFGIGDDDLATHLFRTHRLREGAPLSIVTAELCERLGIECRILPVTDDRLRTVVRTPEGELAFQDYFVRRRAADVVQGLRFDGAETAEPAPGVIDAFQSADAIVIAPSNPFLSIDPLLAVRSVREAVVESDAPVVAISPIIGGVAVKGPAAEILASLGHDVSAIGVARLYAELADVFIIDEQDAALASRIEAETSLRCVAVPTLMSGPAEKRALARAALQAAQDAAWRDAR